MQGDSTEGSSGFGDPHRRESGAGLSDEARKALVLTFANGWSPAQVQSALGIGPRRLGRELRRSIESLAAEAEVDHTGAFCAARRALMIEYLAGLANAGETYDASIHLGYCQECRLGVSAVEQLARGLATAGAVQHLAQGVTPAGALEQPRPVAVEQSRPVAAPARIAAGVQPIGSRRRRRRVGAAAFGRGTAAAPGQLALARHVATAAAAAAIALLIGQATLLDFPPGTDGERQTADASGVTAALLGAERMTTLSGRLDDQRHSARRGRDRATSAARSRRRSARRRAQAGSPMRQALAAPAPTPVRSAPTTRSPSPTTSTPTSTRRSPTTSAPTTSTPTTSTPTTSTPTTSTPTTSTPTYTSPSPMPTAPSPSGVDGGT